MFFTTKKVFFPNHIFKHVTAKFSCNRSSLLATGPSRRCICGTEYHSASITRLYNGTIPRYHFLSRQRSSTIRNYSRKSVNFNNYGEKVVGQTESDYRNAVVEEIKESLKNELSDLEAIELLEIAIRANVKHQDLEFLNCYYNLLCNLDKNNIFYDKYFQHYCQLTKGSLENVNTYEGKEELKKKFELLNRRKSGKNIKSEGHALKNSMLEVSKEIRNDFQLENTFGMKFQKRMPNSTLKAFRQPTVNEVSILMEDIQSALNCDIISNESIKKILWRAYHTNLHPKTINSQYFIELYKLLHKLKDMDDPDFYDYRSDFFTSFKGVLKQQNFSTSYFIPFMTTYGEYVKYGKDLIEGGVWEKVMEKVMRNEDPDLTDEHRFLLLKTMADAIFFSPKYLEYLKPFVMKDARNQTDCSYNSATMNKKFIYLRAMATMSLNNLDCVEHVKELVIENPGLLEQSVENLWGFLETLALSDFQNQRKNDWPHLRSLIAELPVLQDVGRWQESEFFYHLHVMKLLLLWDICPKPLLTSLSDRCNAFVEGDMTVGYYRMMDDAFEVMAGINQLVYALHPSFNKPFLNADTLPVVKNKIKKTSKFRAIQNFNYLLGNVLMDEIDKKDCVLSNIFTRQGLFIDFAMALNEANEVFIFPSEKVSGGECYIDDISLPEGYHWVILLVLRPKFKDISRDNNKTLGSRMQMKKKYFDAMGYLTIPVFRNSLSAESLRHRKSGIWDFIRGKNGSRLLESKIEKFKHPVLLE